MYAAHVCSKVCTIAEGGFEACHCQLLVDASVFQVFATCIVAKLRGFPFGCTNVFKLKCLDFSLV